jgi:hypothetical protein
MGIHIPSFANRLTLITSNKVTKKVILFIMIDFFVQKTKKSKESQI